MKCNHQFSIVHILMVVLAILVWIIISVFASMHVYHDVDDIYQMILFFWCFLCDLFFVCCVGDVCTNHLEKRYWNHKIISTKIFASSNMGMFSNKKTENNQPWKITILSKNDKLSLCDFQKMIWKHLFETDTAQIHQSPTKNYCEFHSEHTRFTMQNQVNLHQASKVPLEKIKTRKIVLKLWLCSKTSKKQKNEQSVLYHQKDSCTSDFAWLLHDNFFMLQHECYHIF